MLPIQRKISSYNHYNSNNPQWIVIHYVGAVSTAKNNADYFYGGNRDASAHYFVDDNSIWQSVEDYHGAWHIGNSVREPNNWNSIGIEMCCQGDGKLTVSVTTENNTVELVQYLMKKYNINIDHVVTHGWTTGYRKICPNWSANNWERFENFKNKVINKPSTPQPSSDLYRVRKSWADASSQVGAYSILQNAKDSCGIGYSVFDSKGNVVFANGGSQPSKPNPQPPKPPVKEKINIFYKTANVNSGYYSLVQNTQDYAGDLRNACARLIAYPNNGEVRFQVSPLNETRFYPEVQNYFSSNSIYDEAGVSSVGFDKFRIRFSLSSYKIRYRAYAGGQWWDWCESINNSYGDWAGKGDGTPITGVQMEIVAL